MRKRPLSPYATCPACCSSHVLLICLLVCFSLGSVAQAELEKVIPLSPNAASISKYGEVPVSYFTGIPNISVPVYHVKSKRLDFPISLSYHAGGNKVEEVPSWVGMGWSLTGAPMISRSVRGIPDEGIDGFFSELTYLYDPETGVETFSPSLSIKQLQDSSYHIYQEGAWWANYLLAVYRNQTDPEADIFHFNLPGKSGKFYWDQVTDEFHTYPWTNIKITYSGNAFQIIDEDGTMYVFPASLRETSTVSGATQGESIPTAWWASKMYDANKTDSIVFTYSLENQVNYLLDGQIKTIFGSCDPSFSGSIATTAAYTLSGISFSNGQVLLTKETTQREDLSGGYALKKVEVFNTSELLIKKVELSYHYRSGSVPSNYSSTLGKRLMLQQVQESGAGGTAGGKYQFIYDTDIEIPHRKSMSQDYWGFFNGRSSNTELTPSVTYMPVSGPPLQVAGADRGVYPDYTQFGILKKIIYPTGGYSEFAYENNIAYNPNLPPAVIQNMASLEFGLSEPGTDLFIDTFEIDVPPHSINAYEGGAVVSSEADYVGVPLNGYADSRALLTVRGLDAGNSSIFYYVSLNNTEFYLPNGRYEIKAAFDQDPPEYENFYFILTWSSLDSADFNTKVGGLRVKSIRSVDGAGKNQYKEYRYTTSFESDTSSGDIFGTPYVVAYDDYWPDVSTYCRRIFAQSTQFTISHSGSFIGYRTVYEKLDSLGTAGLTEYKFTHAKDFTEIEDPFPPAYSMEAFRGQLLQTSHFKRQGNDYIPVSRTYYEYTSKIFDSLSTYCVKVKVLKPGVIQGFNVVSRPWFNWQYYDFAPAWSAVAVKKERLYDQADTNRYVQTVTNYEYDPSHFQLVKTFMTNSKNEVVETKMFYAPDVTLSGSAEDAREEMVQRNMINAVLKQEKKVAGNTVEVLETQFRKYHSAGIVKPELIKVKIGGAAAETRVEFTGYDQHGNLLSQKKTGDVSQAYVWDHNTNLLIAEAVNTTEEHIAYTSFEGDGKGSWTFTGSPVTEANAPTGKKAYDLSNGAVSRSISTSKTYIVTFWATSAKTVSNATLVYTGRTLNGYTFYQYQTNSLAASVQISGSGRIDELRLYPQDARMTTYTYEPLVGVTAQCDLNNNIVYYEYDGLGRLVVIRDLFKNILKKFSYGYHDQ